MEDDWSRDEVKNLMIRIIFGRPHQMDTELGGEWFRERYPTAFEVIHRLKRTHGHAWVGQTLQRMESDVVVNTACERLRRDYSHIPIVTCHDSIATPERHLETVGRVLRESFAAYPSPPSFKVKPPAAYSPLDSSLMEICS